MKLAFISAIILFASFTYGASNDTTLKDAARTSITQNGGKTPTPALNATKPNSTPRMNTTTKASSINTTTAKTTSRMNTTAEKTTLTAIGARTTSKVKVASSKPTPRKSSGSQPNVSHPTSETNNTSGSSETTKPSPNAAGHKIHKKESTVKSGASTTTVKGATTPEAEEEEPEEEEPEEEEPEEEEQEEEEPEEEPEEEEPEEEEQEEEEPEEEPEEEMTTLSTPNHCMCVTKGSCPLVGGNSSSHGSTTPSTGVKTTTSNGNTTPDPNDGSGQLDPRIINPGQNTAPPSGTNQTITSPASSGIPLISESQTDCLYYNSNLDLCCPANGYQCGKVFPPMPDSRIASGRAVFGEFPWQGIVFTTDNVYVGSGVLIDQKNFLTVAYRLQRFPGSKFKIRLGDWDTSSQDEILPEIEFYVSKVTIHSEYDPPTLKNNIAMLKVVGNVPLGRFPTIATACLPQSLIRGLRCFVSGWGRNDFNYGSNQAIQRKVDVPLIERDKCQATLRMTRLGNNFILDRGFLCAGGEVGKDACTGDGGAPLVCNVANTWYVVGLVSWGISCGQNIPGVYMDVNYYLPWIQSVSKN